MFVSFHVQLFSIYTNLWGLWNHKLGHKEKQENGCSTLLGKDISLCKNLWHSCWEEGFVSYCLLLNLSSPAAEALLCSKAVSVSRRAASAAQPTTLMVLDTGAWTPLHSVLRVWGKKGGKVFPWGLSSVSWQHECLELWVVPCWCRALDPERHVHVLFTKFNFFEFCDT